MGKRKSKTTETAERNISLQRANSKAVCSNKKSKTEKLKSLKPGRKQNPKPVVINDSDLIKLTVDHFFKNKINTLIQGIADPRIKDMCTYSTNHLCWLGILMFLFRLKSRNQLLKERETERFHQNLLSLSGTDEETVAHPDAMNYLLKKLPPEELESIKTQLVKELIKNRVLDDKRLLGSYLVAVDASGLFSFKSRHCENCLVTKHDDGTITYSHKMLEAKLVSDNGFAFSICSESIENINDKYIKQDCELNAFYRMEKRLKALFSRTQLCILFDGLYPCKEVFDICTRNNWDFMAVLKPKKMPAFYREAVKTMKKFPKNKLVLEGEKEKQTISWVHNIPCLDKKLHVVFSQSANIANESSKNNGNVWITNFIPRANNAEKLVNKGGRQRWKIENQGFKEQKCDEYELEHLYGEKPNAWKNYYQLLQIAHMITQLIIYSDLCKKVQEYSIPENQQKPVYPFLKYYHSIRNFVRRICESFRNEAFSNLVNALMGKIQIRFSSG